MVPKSIQAIHIYHNNHRMHFIYHNNALQAIFLRKNLSCVLYVQNVLKSYTNSTVTLTWNLNDYFSTLWIFYGDSSISEERVITCPKLFQFFFLASAYEIMIPRQILWFSDSVWFLQNFKTIRPDVRGQCSWARCSKFPSISWIWPHIGLNNVNIKFWLIIFNYSKYLQLKFDLSTRIRFT